MNYLFKKLNVNIFHIICDYLCKSKIKQIEYSNKVKYFINHYQKRKNKNKREKKRRLKKEEIEFRRFKLEKEREEFNKKREESIANNNYNSVNFYNIPQSSNYFTIRYTINIL